MSLAANPSKLKLANALFKNKDYTGALDIYVEALNSNPELGDIIKGNIKLLERKIQQQKNPSEHDRQVLFDRPSPNTSGYSILLVSYYAPTRAHAGGLRILDVYNTIRNKIPTARLDLFTYSRPNIDWSLASTSEIFDNVYLSELEELTVEEFRKLTPDKVFYDVIDLQFHSSGKYANEYRDIGKKILFTPMESQAKVLMLDILKNYKNNQKIYRSIKDNVDNGTEEITFLNSADSVVCVSRPDAALLRKITGSRKVTWIDTCISQIEFGDAATKEYRPRRRGIFSKKILYIAYFGSQTNVNALRWFLNEVHKTISDAVPGYQLQVVGRGDLSEFKNSAYHQVEFVGEADSLESWIQDATVGIAPALEGAGFRGKINQYAAFSLPTVASPIAAKGLKYKHAESILIAESSSDFANACIQLLMESEKNQIIGGQARSVCELHYIWESKWTKIRSIYGLWNTHELNPGLPIVNIVVPSYNHGRYIGERIISIVNQTYRNWRLLVIDDCSDDNSDKVIRELQSKYGFKYIRNSKNSGTPFSSWARLSELPRSDYVWICESDDIADKMFLEIGIEKLRKNPSAVLFYSASKIIDESGMVIGSTDQYFRENWRINIWDEDRFSTGQKELVDFQIQGQTVPNMSSALVRSEAFSVSLDPLLSRLKLTGDWLFIGKVMTYGDVIYSKEKLNSFRKHSFTSRARTKEARSQAEFVITKYLLARCAKVDLSGLTEILRSDGIRHIYEAPSVFNVIKEMLKISPDDAIDLIRLVGQQVEHNGHLWDDWLDRARRL